MEKKNMKETVIEEVTIEVVSETEFFEMPDAAKMVLN